MELNAEMLSKATAYLEQRVAKHGQEAMARVLAAVVFNTTGGSEKLPEDQKPQLFYFPGLEDEPFHDTSIDDELSTVVSLCKNSWRAARDEYLAHVGRDDLIAYETQMPMARDVRKKSGGEEIFLSRDDWGTFSLRLSGEPIEEARNRCPQTWALMKELEPHLAVGGAFFFSVLGPGAHIPPHFDATNIRLTCHLGLVVPEDCGIRVGGQERTWSEGNCLVLDSSFRHDAWNNSDQHRVCLMTDIWNPRLTLLEREVLNELSQFLM